MILHTGHNQNVRLNSCTLALKLKLVSIVAARDTYCHEKYRQRRRREAKAKSSNGREQTEHTHASHITHLPHACCTNTHTYTFVSYEKQTEKEMPARNDIIAHTASTSENIRAHAAAIGQSERAATALTALRTHA